MEQESVDENKLKLLPSSFKFHDFTTRVGEVTITGRIIKMEDSVYIWIGDVEEAKMGDFAVAMISRYEKLPVSTKIFGSTDDTVSTSLAKRLARKFAKPVYVSFNVVVNNLTLPGIEKAIQDELRTQKCLLAF